MTEVQVGDSENGFTEIYLLAGFKESAEIVVKGTYAILSKMMNSEEEGHAH